MTCLDVDVIDPEAAARWTWLDGAEVFEVLRQSMLTRGARESLRLGDETLGPPWVPYRPLFTRLRDRWPMRERSHGAQAG